VPLGTRVPDALARHTTTAYIRFAEEALMELVREQGAVLLREAEAKISDQCWPSVPTAIDPHHLSTARKRLLQRKWLKLSDPIDAGGTRLMHPTDERGKKRAITEASKRKRRLHGRMEKWARARSAGRYCGLAAVRGGDRR
jgi:hypothetical protein